MSDEKRKPQDHDEDRPEVEEVSTEFDGGFAVRSGFSIEEQEPGVLGVNIFGPLFEFLDDDEDDLKDLELNDEDEHECPQARDVVCSRGGRSTTCDSVQNMNCHPGRNVRDGSGKPVIQESFDFVLYPLVHGSPAFFQPFTVRLP
jgi:hypothetical protein